MKRFLSVVCILVALFAITLATETAIVESKDVEIPDSGTETPIIDF